MGRVIQRGGAATRALWQAPSNLAVRPDTEIHDLPPSRPERVVVVAVMFILAYNMPAFWVTPPSASFVVSGSVQSQYTGVLLLGFLFGLANVKFAPGPFVKLMREEWVLPVFLGYAAVSVLWSALPSQSFDAVLQMILIAGIGYWLVVRFPIRQIIGMVAVTFAIGTAVQLALITFLPHYAIFDDDWTGLTKNRNVFGRSVSLAILVFVLAWRTFPRFRVAIWVLIAANALMVVNANSKTSIVASLAAPGLFALFTFFRARRTLYGAVAISMGIAAGVVAYLTTANIGGISEALDRAPNLSGRTPIWTAVWPDVFKRPIFGHGWKGFYNFDPTGPAIDVFRRLGTTIPHSHDALLDALLDVGVIGAGLMILLLLRLFIRGARVIRYYRGATGMLPLLIAAYAVLVSITEYGVFTTDIQFLVFVVAVLAAVPGRRDQLASTFAADRSFHAPATEPLIISRPIAPVA